MEFFVNGQKLDVTLQDEKTVGDVLTSFEMTCEENQLATIGIKLNGTDVDASRFDSILKEPLEDSTKIEVSVISESEIKEQFKLTGNEIAGVIELLKNVPLEMQSGKDASAKKSIIQLSDVMNSFCSTVTWAGLFPKTFGNFQVDGKPLSDFLSEFSPILKDFSDALENSDSVLIGDLAEYEICPRLESLSCALGSF